MAAAFSSGDDVYGFRKFARRYPFAEYDRAHRILNNETWNYTTFAERDSVRRKNLDTLLIREIKVAGLSAA